MVCGAFDVSHQYFLVNLLFINLDIYFHDKPSIPSDEKGFLLRTTDQTRKALAVAQRRITCQPNVHLKKRSQHTHLLKEQNSFPTEICTFACVSCLFYFSYKKESH